MNWTGGALGRSRNANTSLSVIQKKHFAEARGKLQIRHTSPTFEIFGNISIRPARYTQDGRRRSRSQTESRGRTNNNLQQHDSQFDPLHSHEFRRPRSSRPITPQPGTHPSRLAQDATKLSPIIITSRPSSAASIIRDDNLPAANEQNSAPAPSAIDAQRARLLGMRDWVGISHTKPAKIDFADSKDRDQIGKRRRTSDIKHYGGHSKCLRYRSPPPRPRYYHFAANDHLSQADISVRIGSAVDRRSVRDASERRWVSKLDHASAVSDEMLLDERRSDRMANSPNPRDYYHIRGVDSPQQTKARRRSLMPSAFMNEPELPKAEAYAANSTEVIEMPRPFEVGVKHLEHHLPSPHTTQGPVLTTRRPNEEPAPFRFEFARTPRHHEASSETKGDNFLAQYNAIKHSKSRPSPTKAPILRRAQREEHTGHVLTVRDPDTGPRFFDTSPLSRETRSYLIKLQSQDLKPANRDHYALEKPPITISQENGVDMGTDTIEREITEQNSNQLAATATQGSRIVREDEEEGWLRVINADSPEQPARPADLPSVWATDLLDKADRAVAAAATSHGDPVSNQDQNTERAVDEEEPLWRSFCFGPGKTNIDWEIEPETVAEAVQHGRSSSSLPVETQPSMEAEVATSPVKQNPHLRMEGVNSSPVTNTNGASMVVRASSTSPNDFQNSDEMLDGPGHDSSSFHGFSLMQQSALQSSAVQRGLQNSLNEAQASISSPPDTIDPRTRDTVTITPSSLSVQASSTKLPIQLSSDPLAWSPARISQPQTSAKTPMLFKKPNRYVGDKSSDLVEPIRFGRRVSKKSEKMKKLGAREAVEDAGMWEVGAEGDEMGVEDEIEDD